MLGRGCPLSKGNLPVSCHYAHKQPGAVRPGKGRSSRKKLYLGHCLNFFFWGGAAQNDTFYFWGKNENEEDALIACRGGGHLGNAQNIICFFSGRCYKHRKNCECCPGHCLSTSVY